MLKKIFKKIALPVQPPLSCEQGHHEVAIFFILSSRILSSETSTGGLDADGSGLATVGILMSDWGKKKKNPSNALQAPHIPSAYMKTKVS